MNRLASEVPCKRDVPTITVHNGIDIKRFVEACPIKRSRLNLSNKDFVVFFSGRLTREKGILELIKALKQIKEIPHLKLIIAGASFYGKDTTVHPYLKELIKEAKDIKDHVIFTGFIDYKEMPSYLKTANIIVVPSMWEEPFGLTVLEAMAAGVPLIATKSGGIPEVCDDSVFLIERENIVKNLANAITYTYKNYTKFQLLSEKAQMRSWDFDKDSFSRHYLQIIKQYI